MAIHYLLLNYTDLNPFFSCAFFVDWINQHFILKFLNYADLSFENNRKFSAVVVKYRPFSNVESASVLSQQEPSKRKSSVFFI